MVPNYPIVVATRAVPQMLTCSHCCQRLRRIIPPSIRAHVGKQRMDPTTTILPSLVFCQIILFRQVLAVLTHLQQLVCASTCLNRCLQLKDHPTGVPLLVCCWLRIRGLLLHLGNNNIRPTECVVCVSGFHAGSVCAPVRIYVHLCAWLEGWPCFMQLY
uniref:Uncharacterized protein n=1 Tax=Eutreptiella gymnastica TaxID=73025 RepID=A0A6U7ZCI1_9EUGL